jgi:hypothetical protein
LGLHNITAMPAKDIRSCELLPARGARALDGLSENQICDQTQQVGNQGRHKRPEQWFHAALFCIIVDKYRYADPHEKDQQYQRAYNKRFLYSQTKQEARRSGKPGSDCQRHSHRDYDQDR